MTSTMVARGPGYMNRVVGQLVLDGKRTIAGSIGYVNITMTEGEHDEVNLKIASSPYDLNYDMAYNKPCFFPFGLNHQGRFYGYVVDITPEQSFGADSVTYNLTLMGTSVVMKSGRPRFFTDMTAADVIGILAKEHGLGFSDEWGVKHYSWPQLAQTDESDWEFVESLTERIGGVMVCTNGVLRLINPLNVLRRQSPLVYSTRRGDDPRTELFDFSPTHYSDMLPSTYPSAFAYLSGKKVVVVGSLTTTDLPRNFDASTPIRNVTEAQMAQTRLPVSWEEQGIARLAGDHRCEPGALISFDNARTLSFKPAYDGVWYIWRVQHVIEGDSYQTEVSLARVSQSIQLPTISPRFWFTGERGRPQIVMGRNGQWSSSWR